MTRTSSARSLGRSQTQSRVWLAILLAGGATGCGASGGASGPPPGDATVGLEEIASGLNSPLYLTAPTGDARLFIVEQGGTIRIVKDGALLPTPFLDISALTASGGERGLLGLAFDPSYAQSGRFFVSYTNLDGDSRLSSFRVSSDPDVADRGSESIVLGVAQPFANHNGGHIAFGPDGYLWFALGDGGSGGDPLENGQDLTDLLGSLLRLDVSGATGYTIPPDNPFAGRQDARPELWDLGLRNPWRFSFDRETGDLYIGDVGQNRLEEVNVSPTAAGRGRGLNYGWNLMEGTDCFASSSCDRAGLTLPVLDYPHDGGACSVTGGYVYRGTEVSELRGVYFYADFCAGWVRSFRYANGEATEQREWPELEPGGSIPSFGEDARGELYVLTFDGKAFRVVAR